MSRIGHTFSDFSKRNRYPARPAQVFSIVVSIASRKVPSSPVPSSTQFQGSANKVAQNSKVGTVHVTGIKPRPKGELDIKATFMVSDQQIVTVIIEQKESGIYIVEKMQVA